MTCEKFENVENVLEFAKEISKVSIPICFYWTEGEEVRKQNASGTFISINGTTGFLLTNHHVIDAYREIKSTYPDCVLQIGSASVSDLEIRIIDENKDLDLITIRIRQGDLEVAATSLKNKAFYLPEKWPTNMPVEGEELLLVGYLGVGTKLDIEKGGISYIQGIFCLKVGIVQEHQFAINAENPHAVVGGILSWEEVTRLGGISGAGVFALRNETYELVGIVWDGGLVFGAIQIWAVPAERVLSDGRIG
jgi:hypothetical protein